VKQLITIILILLSSIQLHAQTVITEPNPVLRYETMYTLQDMRLQSIDTSLENFHRYQPHMQWGTPYLTSNMGNTPRPLQFVLPTSIGYKTGYSSLDNYFLSSDSVHFYNTKTPFTSAEYDFGIGDESYVKLTHAQNIKPYLNMAIDYKRPASKGFYNRQKSGIHNFAFSQWYQAPSDKYNWMSAYVFNQVKIEENGGVTIDDIFTNPAYSQDKSDAPVTLYDANNKLNDNQVFFLQTFNFGPVTVEKDSVNKEKISPKYGLSHRFEFNSRKIWYQDNEDSTKTFYNNYYLYNDSTRDFTKSQTIKNELFFQNHTSSAEDSSTHGFKYAWKGGIRYSANKYLQNIFSVWRHSLQLFGSIKNNPLHTNKWSYDVRATVELAPKYSGDFHTSAYLKFQPSDVFQISPSLHVNLSSPSMKMERLTTNHFSWNNHFKKQFSIHANTLIGVPKWKAQLGVDYYLVENYLYYDEDNQASQFNHPLQIIRVSAEKNFFLKNFVFKNLLGYQFVSHNDIINQPKIYFKGQWYYRGSYIKKKPLHAQLGIDFTYFSHHFADAYQPALMEYYLQNEQQLNFYPLIDVFFNLQVKRTRIFLVLQHITQGLFKEKGYYTHPNSPATPRALRLGVSWQFYD